MNKTIKIYKKVFPSISGRCDARGEAAGGANEPAFMNTSGTKEAAVRRTVANVILCSTFIRLNCFFTLLKCLRPEICR